VARTPAAILVDHDLQPRFDMKRMLYGGFSTIVKMRETNG